MLLVTTMVYFLCTSIKVIIPSLVHQSSKSKHWACLVPFLALPRLALPSQERHFDSPLLGRKSLLAQVRRHPSKESKKAVSLCILTRQGYVVTSDGSKQARSLQLFIEKKSCFHGE
jgi:hypothetical protein